MERSAPPRVADGLPESVVCPFCDRRESHLLNPFGGQLSVAQYWCRHCRTGFEYIKWEDDSGVRH
jgi:hypothetical protein